MADANRDEIKGAILKRVAFWGNGPAICNFATLFDEIEDLFGSKIPEELFAESVNELITDNKVRFAYGALARGDHFGLRLVPPSILGSVLNKYL